MRAIILILFLSGISLSSLGHDVLFIGDSITWGQLGDVPNSENKYSENAFTRIIEELYKDKNIKNIAVSGSNTYMWRPGGEFFQRILDNLPAKKIHVLLGTNDSVGFFRESPVSPSEYKRNLEAMINTILKASHRTEIVLSNPPYRPSINDFQANLRIKRYAFIVKELIHKYKSVKPGLDLRTLIHVSHYENFDIHPTSESHHKVCENLIELLF